MLTKIEVINSANQMLTLDMFDSSNGYDLERVEGLEPAKASFASSTLFGIAGELYQSTRTDKRNIVITLGLDPDYVTTSVQELRRGLYAFFLPGTEVVLRFYMDEVGFAEITARSETFDAPFFEAEPKVVISLLCFDPYFRKILEDVQYEDLGTPLSFNYSGDINTGVEVSFSVGQAFSDFSLSITNDLLGTQSMSLDFEFEIDDGVKIVTIPGKKEITLHRGGQSSSILAYLLPGSAWPLIAPGTNDVLLDSESIPWAPYPHAEYKFVTKYGGL